MEQLRQEVIVTQRKFNDLLDDRSRPAARTLVREIQALEDDLQCRKNPRTIEDRVKRIIQVLEHDAEHERIMNNEHLAMFVHWFEHLREQLRKLG